MSSSCRAISFAARTIRGMSAVVSGRPPGTDATHSEPQTSPRQAIGAAPCVSLPSEAARLAEDTSTGSPWPKQYGVRRSSSVTSAGNVCTG